MEKVYVGGEFVCLKKSSVFGWTVIHPYKNDDGSINGFNLLTGGSWANFTMWIVITLIIVGVLFEYTSNINTLISCFDNPINLQNCKEAFGYTELIFNP